MSGPIPGLFATAHHGSYRDARAAALETCSAVLDFFAETPRPLRILVFCVKRTGPALAALLVRFVGAAPAEVSWETRPLVTPRTVAASAVDRPFASSFAATNRTAAAAAMLASSASLRFALAVFTCAAISPRRGTTVTSKSALSARS